MTYDAYPDGPSIAVAGEQEALRVAAREFPGDSTVVAVEDGTVLFLRRDVTGAFTGLRRRPPVAEELGLLPHPEGGWFRETWRTSAEFVPAGYDGPRQSATGIYFLLAPGEESVWHAVRSDEVWFWHRGGPLTLTLGGTGREPGEPAAVTLGPRVEDGELPQVIVPAGTWQAARPTGAEAVLVSCVVSPGFDFADFTAL
nr:cupin domain-containing protein [Sphaerisporangium rubeum]